MTRYLASVPSDVPSSAAWTIVPMPLGVLGLIAAMLVLTWYARRMLRGELAAHTKMLRIFSISTLGLACLAMFLGTCVFDPDSPSRSDRLSFLISWTAVGFGVAVAVILASIDLVFIGRGGARELRALHREVMPKQERELKS